MYKIKGVILDGCSGHLSPLYEQCWVLSFDFGLWLFGSVKEPKESLCLSVCLSGTNLPKGLNLHLRAVWVSLRSV